MIRGFRRAKKIRSSIETYEVFIDAKNLPQFNTHQMEGRIEKPISRSAIYAVGFVFALIASMFSWQLGKLQIVKGVEYAERSEKNSLDKKPIFSERGIIYDRNQVELAWNVVNTEQPEETFANRAYKEHGFAHLLGYVGYPAKDKSGNYWQEVIVGKDGLEKRLDTELRGINGLSIFESDARGKVSSENVINPPQHGKNITLTIDARVQEKLYQSISELAQSSGYVGGGGVIMDVTTGEILALTSYPEYNSSVLSTGDDRATITGYFQSKSKPFMNRVVSGIYTPGSIVKPFLAVAALNEGVINPYTNILSTGKLVIPNPYGGPDSVFNDNKAHGYVDMRKALAVSSNVYFYEIGGGFQNQKGLGISNIEKYARAFGIGEKTGIEIASELAGTIPSPAWKAKNFPGDPWRIGDTYHTAIGQYGFQVTPIQMVRAIAAIANKGTLVRPHLILDDTTSKANQQPVSIPIPPEDYQVVQEGMRKVVTEGTGIALSNVGVSVAAKSGTAQVGVNKDRTNAWVIGFFPYEHPRYAFTVLMESGAKNGSAGAAHAMKPTLEWMAQNTPEYVQ